MEVVAIGGRGSRKDFVDLYFFLRSGGALDTLMDLLRRRFAGVDYRLADPDYAWPSASLTT